MFGIADLAIVAAINDGLNHLAKNPQHIEFILNQFCSNKTIRAMVGRDYIKECADLIANYRIHVAPVYEIDIKRRPYVSVVTSGVEDTMFLGDFGNTQENPVVFLAPIVYASFDAKSINKDELTVSPAANLEKKIWPGVIISNGTESARVKGVLVRHPNDTVLHLDRELPEGTRLSDWQATSQEGRKGYSVNASMDKISAQITLVSTGDYSVHRLLSIVIRYCLKRGRTILDQYGLQTATFSYTPPIASDETELEFQSVFTLEGRMLDQWIEYEYEYNDNTKNVLVCIIADNGETVVKVD